MLVRKVLPEERYIRLKCNMGRFVWGVMGELGPPSGVKVGLIKDLSSRFGIKTLVETGTCRGDAIRAVLKDFNQIYSIELDESLYKGACQRFAKFPYVHIAWGDSGELLPVLVGKITDRTIFWLDAHYSGGVTAGKGKGCPVVRELRAMRKARRTDHLILIDDAGSFAGETGYPHIDELCTLITAINPSYKVEVKDNIVRAFVSDDAGVPVK